MPAASDTVTAAEVLKIAAGEIGYREGRSNDNKYGRAYGVNGTAWCAQFIWWIARQAGAKDGEFFPKTAWCPDLLSYARRNGLIIRDPKRGDHSGASAVRPGDIMLVQRRPGETNYSPNGAKHVGIVERVRSDGRLQTIEGNTSNTGSASGNGVYRLVRTITEQIVIFRPKWDAAGGSGGGGTPPKTTDYHIDPAKVETFLWGLKHGEKPNIVGRPGRNLDIAKISGRWAITPSGNYFDKSYLKKGKAPKPITTTVDLSQLRAAAKNDPDAEQGGTTKGAVDDVKIVEACLVAEGLLDEKWDGDGSFGSSTIAAYAEWQRSPQGGSYRGDDADGVPGESSLKKLVEQWGYEVVA